jgi:hypothetical protein
VLFVEGDGDKEAVPVLVTRLLTNLEAWGDLFLDTNPFVVGGVAQLTARDGRDWLRYLEAAGRRRNVGAVLLLLDGDAERIRGESFCAKLFAIRLATLARQAGAGATFSLAVVFASQEYESWMIASADRLGGLPLPDGRPGLRAGATPPEGDLERAPRDAKGWLDRNMDGGYSPTRDQGPLTRLFVDHLAGVRQRQMRSFRRLENAVRQIVEAVRGGTPIATPDDPPGTASTPP